MSVVSVHKNSFAAGEVAPALCERFELERHNISCKTMKNFIIHPLGYAYNRGGTYYVGETKDSSKASRLIPWQFSVDDSYALEFGNLYIRVIRNGAYVESGGSPYEIVTPYLEADLFDLDYEQSGDYMYITHPSYAPRTLTRSAHDNWTLATYTTGAGVSAPANFTRSAGSGTGSNYTVTAVNAYGEESVAATALTNNGPGDTWTWDKVTGAEFYNVYKDAYQSGYYGWIGNAVDGVSNVTFTEPSGGIDPDYTKGPPQGTTLFNATDDYPGCCATHQQRLLMARTNNNPDTIWGSQVGAFNNHNYTLAILDDDAYEFTLDSTQVNEIRWMIEFKDLIIGTAGTVLKMMAGYGKNAITATSVRIIKQSGHGVAKIPPIILGNELIFVAGSKKEIRSLFKATDIEGNEVYDSISLSILASHLFDDYTINDFGLTKYPHPITWDVRSDGVLLGMSYLREQALLAWYQQDTDGYFESLCSILDTNGVSQTYVIVRRTINGATKRYVEMFKDRLPVNDAYVPEIQDAFFVDCGLSLDSPITITNATQADPVVITAASHGLSTDDYVDISDIVGMTDLNGNQYQITRIDANSFSLNNIDGTGFDAYESGGYARKAVTDISGLGHLEGKDVSVLANGIKCEGHSVSGGALSPSLTNRASRVHVGLPYTCDLETTDFVHDTKFGSSADKIKAINNIVLSLENAYSLQVGPDEDHLSPVDFSDCVYTGVKECGIIQGNDLRKNSLLFRTSDPLPVSIISVTGRSISGDR